MALGTLGVPSTKGNIRGIIHSKKICAMFQNSFKQHFLRSYAEENAKKEVGEQETSIIAYALEKKVITEKTQRHYSVIKECYRLRKEEGLNKTQAVQATAVKFELAESTVWNILKDQGKNFGH